MNVLMNTGGVYHGIPPEQDKPSTITGRNLVHGKRTKVERAFVAGDLHRGILLLTTPTIGQAADLLHVNRTYVEYAVMVGDDQATRAAVLAGDCTILSAAKAAAPETLAEHFARATPSEWLKCARKVGPAAVWDHMIAPLV